ncbi:YcxB family protein [Kitasatospora kazusensis]
MTVDDLHRGLRIASGDLRRRVLVYFTVYLLLVVPALWLSPLGGLGYLGLVPGAVLLWLMPHPKRLARAQLSGGPGDVEVLLTDDQVCVRTPYSSPDIPWSAFLRTAEDQGHLFLVITRTNVLPLRKELLSAAELSELRALLAARTDFTPAG